MRDFYLPTSQTKESLEWHDIRILDYFLSAGTQEPGPRVPRAGGSPVNFTGSDVIGTLCVYDTVFLDHRITAQLISWSKQWSPGLWAAMHCTVVHCTVL